jgi:hypothetical protein
MKTNRIKLFREIIHVYSLKHKKGHQYNMWAKY